MHCVPVTSKTKPEAHEGRPVVPHVPIFVGGQFVHGLLPDTEYDPGVHGIGAHRFETESYWVFV